MNKPELSDYGKFVMLINSLRDTSYYCGEYDSHEGHSMKPAKQMDEAYRALLDWYNNKE